MIRNLFVYGTIRRGFDHPAARRLHRHATWLGPAHIQGMLYLAAGYPALVPSYGQDDLVHGELFRLATPRLFPHLDCYEECGPRSPHPTPYRRIRHPVKRHDGADVEAWVYVYTQTTHGLRRLGGGRFSRISGRGCRS